MSTTETAVGLEIRGQEAIGAATKAFQGSAQEALNLAERFAITTPEEYGEAAEHLKVVKGRWGAIEEQRKKITGPLNTALKSVNALFAVPLSILEMAEKRWKKLIGQYDDDQEARRREAQRKLDELAQAEQKRLADLAEKRAKRAEASGNVAKAQEIRESVPEVVAPAVQMPPTPEVAGLSTRTVWFAQIADVPAFVTALACGEAPMEAVTPKVVELMEAYLSRRASSAMRIAGVRVWSEKRIASGKA